MSKLASASLTCAFAYWLAQLPGAAAAASPQPAWAQPRRLTARAYNSGFALAHDTYNGLSCGHGGGRR